MSGGDEKCINKIIRDHLHNATLILELKIRNFDLVSVKFFYIVI
jgi:hypothetical protein